MLGLFAMTASCTNDDLTNGETKDNKQINGTVFVGERVVQVIVQKQELD